MAPEIPLFPRHAPLIGDDPAAVLEPPYSPGHSLNGPAEPLSPRTKTGRALGAGGHSLQLSQNAGHHTLSIHRDGAPLGHISFSHHSRNREYADLNEVYVEPGERRKGLASGLYAEMAALLRGAGCKWVGGEVMSQSVMDLRFKQFGPFDLICTDLRDIPEIEAREYLPPSPPDDLRSADCRKVFVRNRITSR